MARRCGADGNLFLPVGRGGGGFEAADCSVVAATNDTEHADRRLAGVFISYDDARRYNYGGKGGDVWRRG